MHKRYHQLIELQRHTGYGVVTFRKPLTGDETQEEKKLLQAKSSNGIINTIEEEILIGVALKRLSIPEEQTLVRLEFGGAAVSSQQLSDLCQALARNNKIKFLNLSRVVPQLGDGETEIIAEMLKTNTTLIELHLAFNQIGNSGAKAIASALFQNRSSKLVELNMRGNQIGNEGAKSFNQILKVIFMFDLI